MHLSIISLSLLGIEKSLYAMVPALTAGQDIYVHSEYIDVANKRGIIGRTESRSRSTKTRKWHLHNNNMPLDISVHASSQLDRVLTYYQHNKPSWLYNIHLLHLVSGVERTLAEVGVAVRYY
jgi:hypothetical protein